MFEVVLYATLAVIVLVAFYSVLGKSVGQGEDTPIEPETLFGRDQGEGEEAPAFVEAAGADIDDGTGLAAVAAAMPGFSSAEFIDGAKTAYSWILEAFAAGDRDMLGNLLTPDVLKIYTDAIDAREAENMTQVTDLGRLRTCAIDSAKVEDGTARIRVLFEADIASALRNSDGEVVEGDPDMLASISEYWTFDKAVTSKDPAWRLSDVEPSEGDDLPADPTPDTKPAPSND